MESIDLKQTMLAWNKISKGYDDYVTPSHDGNFTKGLLDLAGLKPGMSFLDVAAGTGALSMPAARVGAAVTAVDISPDMIRLLKVRASREGLTNVDGHVMDGQALDLPDNSFDITGSQFGVMLFPDLPKGLSEMVRVTKPGGTVLVIAFSEPDRVDFIKFFFTALQIVVPDFKGLSRNPPPLPFQLSSPEVFRKKMQDARLQDIRIVHEVEKVKFASGSALWNSVTSSNPIASKAIAGLTDEQRLQVQLTLDTMVREQAEGKDVAILETELNVGVGRKV